MRNATPAGRPSLAEYRPRVERTRSTEEDRNRAWAGVPAQPPPAERDARAARRTHGGGALEALVDTEIIPRLARIHHLVPPASSARAATDAEIQSAEVAALVAALSRGNTRVGEDLVDALVRQGWHYERLLLDLLGPAARQLGVLWEEDACCFSDVTIAMLRLRDLLRTLSTRFERSARAPCAGLRACLAAVPGEQHVFGLEMLATLFRRAGWDVDGALHEAEASMITRMGQNRYDMIGLSLSGETHLDSVAAFIRRLRRASRNRHVGIMVGGNLFNERPELVSAVGADLSAPDGPSAVAAAERWVSAVVDT